MLEAPAGMSPTNQGSRFVSWARAAGGRVLRLFGGSRVLQVEEVRVGLSEHLETQALRGLRQRYLPSRVSIFVSEEDHRCLQPFSETISQMTQEEARRRILGADWRATAERIDVALLVDSSLKTGEQPKVTTAYPSGSRRAGWRWRDAGRDREPAAGIAESGSGCICLTLTVAEAEGTALQEERRLVLDPRLPVRVVDSESSENETVGLSPDGKDLVDQTGTRWSPPEHIEFEIRPPLEFPKGDDTSADSTWNTTWAEISVLGGGRVIWCPGGTAVIGRLKEHAHVVPQHVPQSVSRQQIRLQREAHGAFRVTDLGATNGTWIEGRKLRPFEDLAITLPSQIRVGELGRLVVDIR